MKKISLIMILLAVPMMALADGMAFEPDTAPKSLPTATSANSADGLVNTNFTAPIATGSEMGLGNKNLQNALTELDSAQIEVRNKLLDVKAKYTEVDANYKSVKAERESMKKQVKNTEKKIKNIDKQKESIRKSMQI